MTTPLYALIGFVFWTVFLVVSIGTVRSYLVMTGSAVPNGFDSGTRHGGDAYWRLNRAHINCLENLPIFASLVLVAAVIGAQSTTLDNLARVIVIARVGQSLAHISSGSATAVKLRFTFFLAQVVSFCWFAIWLVV
jgi:hypothetical protein